MSASGLDIVMITAFRPSELKNCLASLERARHAYEDEIHLYLGINGASPEQTAKIREVLTSENSWQGTVTVLAFSRKRVGAARNELLKQARSSWVFFCDDDVEVPARIFVDWRSLVDAHPEVAVFGGPNITPSSATEFERIQGAILGSPWGGGPFYRRYATGAKDDVATASSLTLCNLFVRRTNESLRDRRFPDVVLGGEELSYLSLFEEPFFWSERLRVTHRRRDSMASFYRQVVKYGVGRTHATPGRVALFGGAALAAVVIGFWVFPDQMAALVLLIVAFEVAVAIGHGVRLKASAISCLQIQLALHVGYFYGLIKGFFPSSREFAPIRE